ncbi:CLUMA_CG005843, isoform A [Clunio marinus]|uniref:CLUMA_CG005843, isoform A n=1 Tax=Clunio marinus TaxID=568069 RepID=A0A1J1HXZ0_9DIPT|nr:CLUMA_CG005843, isoform A [Clunio marinus]
MQYQKDFHAYLTTARHYHRLKANEFIVIILMMAQAEGQGNELSFEMLKNTQHIAEQAALKAKEIAMRSKVPDIPVRGSGENQKAPEIPPKRLNLKKVDDKTINGDDGKPIPVPQRNQAQKVPPPIPQKPSSAQNSPRLKDKTSHQTQQMQQHQQLHQPQNMFHERVSQSPQLSAKNQNIVNILNSPLFQQRANQYKMQQHQVEQQNHTHMIRQQQMKPDEDFGSEDALRGIERGLKNMERAMKEQMTMRNMDFMDGKGGEMQFNPMEFKRSLGGSINSLDGSNNQNMRMMNNMRLNFDGQMWNQRGIERNFSMDQMRLEALQGTGPMKGIPMDFQQPKIQHNIYRSLDRTLPLELQFSRHRQQQEFEFMRQNNQNIIQQRQQGLSREDVNLRRRSSHDETQYIMQQQQQKQSSGNTTNIDNTGVGLRVEVKWRVIT